jgi:MATE family multidrug resistance protein
MGHEGQLLEMESAYAQVLLFGGLALLASRTMNQYFFGMHRPGVIAVAAIVGNSVNVIGNYALIYGERGLPEFGLPGVPGAPELGVTGAAIATVFGTCIELMIPLAVFLSPSWNRRYGTWCAWRWETARIVELLRLGWPAAMQWGSEIICWSIFMTVLVGLFGPDHMTAGWAVLGYMQLSFMPAVGFSTAVSSLVGRYIGAGQPDVAARRARLGVGLSMVYMTLCAVLMIAFRTELVASFVSEAASEAQRARIVSIGAGMMVCAAIFQAFDALGVVYSGALRGAGDTVWPGIVTIVLSWALIVGLGYAFVRLVPSIESIGPWTAAAVYIIVLGLTMWRRFESGKWRSIRLVEPVESSQVAAVTVGPPVEG